MIILINYSLKLIKSILTLLSKTKGKRKKKKYLFVLLNELKWIILCQSTY